MPGPRVLAVMGSDERDRARAERDWRRADWIRDAPVDAGTEVHDGADAITWVNAREGR